MSEGAETPGLAGRAARGAAFIVAARFVMRAFGFVNTIVLARLLAPADFGLVAVGVTAMQLLQGFSDIGVSQAVVKFRDADRRDLDTLFTLAAFRGAAIAAVLLLAAPFVADFYHDQRMARVFAAIALFPVMQGLVNPRFFEFERALDFSKEFMSNALVKFASVTVSITIAIIWRSYWAIIIGFLAGGALQLVASYAWRPYRPRPTFASLKKVFAFSGWLTGVSFVAALNNKLDAFVLARAVGTASTGVYYVGFQLAELPTSEIAVPIARAIYPGLSALQADIERMRAAFLRGVEALGAVAMPAAIGFALVAKDLIPLLLGEKWSSAIPVVEMLTPVLGLQTLLVATQFYAMARGLTRLVFIREVVFFLTRFPAFVFAAATFGLKGAVAASALAGFIHIALSLGIYARASGRAFFEPYWSARRSFASTAAMAFVVGLALPAIAGFADLAPALRLLAEIALGALVYSGAHLALWRAEGRPAGVETMALAALGAGFARLKRA